MLEVNELYEDIKLEEAKRLTHGFDFDKENAGKLDLSELKIEIDVADIDQYENKDYALLRKNGLGTSDASVVLGVNPFNTRSDLIEEKCRSYLTEKELEVGNLSAVRKGRELEPLIIHKHTQIMDRRVIKPVDMYRHKDYPYIKFNFDGVLDKFYKDDGAYQYIPDEIKVVTMYGKKHYQFDKATFREGIGWQQIPPHYEKENLSIEDKAAKYGIPPYYYTQLQQQIFGLNAPYGFLTVMLETDWLIKSWFIWRDDAVINKLILEDTKTWDIIERKRPKDFDLGVEVLQ